ncbi:hypothetical protein BD410DRAFT_809103 [Rickenella mellea]|uniref:Uncharacterized protein n=1 Tax=Rickenella mellea TaxID=50990 RepID=A0A4Y7PJN1_9AGAM|nr:hypothetical protein BD410DRAFT_809103 [Rickenella mellea]
MQECNSPVRLHGRTIYLCNTNRDLGREEENEEIVGSSPKLNTFPLSLRVDTIECLKRIVNVVQRFHSSDAAVNWRNEVSLELQHAQQRKSRLEDNLADARTQLKLAQETRKATYESSVQSRTVVQWSMWRIEAVQRQLDWQAATAERLGIPNRRQHKPRPTRYAIFPRRVKEVLVSDPLEGFGATFCNLETWN